MKNLPKDLKILQDFFDASYDLEVNDLQDIASHALPWRPFFDSIQIAVMHNKTEETAMSMMFWKHLESENLYDQVFNTREAAIKWLTDK